MCQCECGCECASEGGAGDAEGNAGMGEGGVGAEGALVPAGASLSAASGGVVAGDAAGSGDSGGADCRSNGIHAAHGVSDGAGGAETEHFAGAARTDGAGGGGAIWCTGWFRGSGRWRIARWNWWSGRFGAKGIQAGGSASQRVSAGGGRERVGLFSSTLARAQADRRTQAGLPVHNCPRRVPWTTLTADGWPPLRHFVVWPNL